MAISLEELTGHVGKHISAFCDTKYIGDAENHCAHFVSHVLNLQLGMLCGDLKFETKKKGASIRCNELYNALLLKGPWDQRLSQNPGHVLIFITSARNVTGNFMIDSPRKHVGICHSGKIFHYSNTKDQVVVDLSTTDFHNKFKRQYGSSDVSLFYGVPPCA